MSGIEIINGKSSEYLRFKKLLDKGKHPGFIGKKLFYRCAFNGGAFLLRKNDLDIGCALMNVKVNNLLCLNILPNCRNKKYGKLFLDYLKPNFIRSIEQSVKFFEDSGYKKLGKFKQGKRHKIFILVRNTLIEKFASKKKGENIL